MLHDGDLSKTKHQNTLFLMLFQAAFYPYLNNLITQQNNAELSLAILMHEIMIEEIIQLQFQRRIEEVKEDFERLEKLEMELADKIKLNQISDDERKHKEAQIFAELNALKQKLEKIREDLNKRIDELNQKRDFLILSIEKNIRKYDELYSKTLKEASVLMKDKTEVISFGEKSKIISYNDLINKLEEKLSGKFASGEIQIEDKDKVEKATLIELIVDKIQQEIKEDVTHIMNQVEDVAQRFLNKLKDVMSLTQSYKESEEVLCTISEDRKLLKINDKELRAATTELNEVENEIQVIDNKLKSGLIDLAINEKIKKAGLASEDDLELDNDSSDNTIPPSRQDGLLERSSVLDKVVNGNVRVAQGEKSQSQVSNSADTNNTQHSQGHTGNDNNDNRNGLRRP